jgi:hypothetical protein
MILWSYLKTVIFLLILITLTTTVWANGNDSVSILVSGNADFGTLAADNILSDPQSIKIDSTSNVTIKVYVKAPGWTSDGGNMPLSALKFGASHMAITTDNQLAITKLETNSSQNVNLYMQIPFGSLPNDYSTTVTWTASTI